MMIGFYNGISGVKSQGFGIDVVANNISNVNNVGFKSSTPEFKSIFYQTLAQSTVSHLLLMTVSQVILALFDIYRRSECASYLLETAI
ncbi:flagellar hook protein [Campylobacter hyointestinalis]|nr:flagellar hook protein [Campylobacter hyointestinalis]